VRPNEFWESDDRCRDQKFYTAFCILASACSDYAAGIKLKRQNNLNWACTVLYYSLVHAARLMCFVQTGDFPTAHNQLGDLLRQGWLRVGGRNTWIGKKLQPYVSRYGDDVQPVTEFSLYGLSTERQNLWGEILERARKLRDDANYEGLLISHEYSHTVVTESFGRLASALHRACETLLPDAVCLFKDFVDQSPRRDCWYAFLNWQSGHSPGWAPLGEGLYYLNASLAYRQADKRTIAGVLGWLEGLRREPDVDVWRAEEVHTNIVMSAFAIKETLMNDFRDKIVELEKGIGGASREEGSLKGRNPLFIFPPTRPWGKGVGV